MDHNHHISSLNNIIQQNNDNIRDKCCLVYDVLLSSFKNLVDDADLGKMTLVIGHT